MTTSDVVRPHILHVRDVEQGDSIVLELATGEIIMVDCNKPHDAERPPVLDVLEEIWARRKCYDIDVLCLTHPDRDHYHGLVEILDTVEARGGRVKNLILYDNTVIKEYNARLQRALVRLNAEAKQQRGTERAGEAPTKLKRLNAKNNEFYNLYQRLINIRKQIKGHGYAQASQFAHFRTFGTASIYILGPLQTTVDTVQAKVWDELIESWLEGSQVDAVATNALSCLLWIVLGKHSILLTGDTTHQAWNDALDNYETNQKQVFGLSLGYDIVKAPHHGSRTGSNVGVWTRVLKPNQSYVIISNGVHARYGHPHEETLQDIKRVCALKGLMCTNVCPAYRNAYPLASRIPNDLLRAVEEDSKPLPVATSALTRSSNKYHSHCRFVLHDNGSIEAETEVLPAPVCRFHTEIMVD